MCRSATWRVALVRSLSQCTHVHVCVCVCVYVCVHVTQKDMFTYICSVEGRYSTWLVQADILFIAHHVGLAQELSSSLQHVSLITDLQQREHSSCHQSRDGHSHTLYSYNAKGCGSTLYIVSCGQTPSHTEGKGLGHMTIEQLVAQEFNQL